MPYLDDERIVDDIDEITVRRAARVDIPSLAVLREVRNAVLDSYIYGEMTDELTDEARAFMDGDGGLLHALNIATALVRERENATMLHGLRHYLTGHVLPERAE